MKTLTYKEMLSFEEAQNFRRKDNPAILADYLVRRLYGKRLSDFEQFSESFEIDAPIAKLIISEDNSELVGKIYSTARLIEIFKTANSLQDNPSIFQETKSLINSTANWVKSGSPTADKDIFSKRKAICDSCEFWEEKSRLGLGKCTKCGCSSFKLRLLTEKCPIGKW